MNDLLNHEEKTPEQLAIEDLLAKKNFARTGRLLYEKHPELANELNKEYLPEVLKARDTDLANLDIYFHKFLKIQNLTWEEYIGRGLGKSKKTQLRKLFTAAMVIIYKPELLHYSAEENRGFKRALCRVIKIKDSSMGSLIKQVVNLYNNKFKDKFNERFASHVDTVVKRIEKKKRIKN